MNSEWLLSLLSLGTASLGWALWVRRIRKVAVPNDRRGFVACMLTAVALGAAAFTEGVGLWAGLAAGGGVAAGGLYLMMVAISAQKGGSGAFVLGEPIPSFEAQSDAGDAFSLSQQIGVGRPLLLKFFRGHW